MRKISQALRRSPSPAAQQPSHEFKVEVQNEGQVTHRLSFLSPLPVTAAEVLSSLQARPEKLEGVLVVADNPNASLLARAELDPAKTYILLDSGQRRRSVNEQFLLALTLRNSFQPTSSRSTQGERSYRARAVQYYYGQPYDSQMELRDMLTGQLFPAEKITASHIYRKHWINILEFTGLTKHDERNLLLLHQKAEERLDRQEWTIIPRDGSQFQVYVLKPSLLDTKSREQYVTGEKDVRWTDVHLKLLQFEGCVSGSRPARRVCGFHAAVSISHAEQEGWIRMGEVHVPDGAWESEGYDKELMETFLSGKRDVTSSAGSDAF